MAHHPMRRPDSEKFAPSDAAPNETAPRKVPPPSAPFFSESHSSLEAKQEHDVAELAAKFAAHGGGKIPPELSGELALDVVLNEIVEQACAATGATGAAIALARGDEMVCRASSGGTAPELGTRLDMHSGLSGECVRSRQMQRCDDALDDPRVDAEISRQLGVRSVMVLPLVQDEQVIGIFEIFSARPAAFGERDQRALELLAERVLKNAQALQSSLLSLNLEPPQAEFEAAVEGTDYDSLSERDLPEAIEAGSASVPRFDWLTILMGGIVVAVALLMGAAFAMHMGWLKANGSQRSPRAQATATLPSPTKASTEPTNVSGNVPGSITAGNTQLKSATGESESRQDARIPEGGLRVYENGKEVFRMQPTDAGATAPQPAKVVELSSEAAEGNLIRRVEPDYPEAALSQRVQGPVLLDVRIGEEGTVQEIKVVNGSPLLAEAAVAAVRQWQFRPRTVNGRPVAMETRINLNFTLPPS
jgi:TonB family protein